METGIAAAGVGTADGGNNDEVVPVDVTEGLEVGPAAPAGGSTDFYEGLLNLSRLVWSFALLLAFSGPSMAILPVFSEIALYPHVVDLSTTIQTGNVADRDVECGVVVNTWKVGDEVVVTEHATIASRPVWTTVPPTAPPGAQLSKSHVDFFKPLKVSSS